LRPRSRTWAPTAHGKSTADFRRTRNDRVLADRVLSGGFTGCPVEIHRQLRTCSARVRTRSQAARYTHPVDLSAAPAAHELADRPKTEHLGRHPAPPGTLTARAVHVAWQEPLKPEGVTRGAALHKAAAVEDQAESRDELTKLVLRRVTCVEKGARERSRREGTHVCIENVAERRKRRRLRGVS